jgi:hypothetical protein
MVSYEDGIHTTVRAHLPLSLFHSVYYLRWRCQTNSAAHPLLGSHAMCMPIVTLRIECTRLLSRAGRQPSCRWSSLCEDATTRKAIHVLCRKLVSSCQGYSYSHRRTCLPTRSLPQRGMSSVLDALYLKVPFAFDAVPQCDFVHSIRSL